MEMHTIANKRNLENDERPTAKRGRKSKSVKPENLKTENPNSRKRPPRPPKDKEQKIKCNFCPRSFSTPRWNTGSNHG